MNTVLDLKEIFEKQEILNNFYNEKCKKISPWHPWMADPKLGEEEIKSRVIQKLSGSLVSEEEARFLVIQEMDHLRVEAAQKFVTAINEEMSGELLPSLDWAWWKNYKTIDWQNAKVEITDILHFFISLAMVCKVNAEDLSRAYIEKNAVNKKRQEEGYTKKDEDDCRHI